jgi:hypothetical protein
MVGDVFVIQLTENPKLSALLCFVFWWKFVAADFGWAGICIIA